MNFTWNRKWIYKFESPWGILEKFKYANNATSKDIYEIFGKKINSYRYGKKYQNLLTLEGFDEDKFVTYLDIPIKKTLDSDLKSITNVFNISNNISNKYSRQKLTFCPQCFKSSYHSIFHQFSLLSFCPFHPEIKLMDYCPNCHKEVIYELNDEIKIPFTCNCGYSFLDTTMLFRTWEIKDKTIKVTSKFKRWINLNRYESNTKILFLEDIFLNREGEIIDNILKRTENIFYSKNISRQAYKLMLCKENEEQEINIDDIYISSKRTFSAIARRLRKTILKKHIGCIKRYKRNSLIQETCPYAFSYIHWKQHIQGYENHFQVDNTYRPKRWFNYFIEFASKQDHKYLESIYQQLNLLIESTYKNKQVIIEMIMNRIMAFFVIEHFYSWLNITAYSNKNQFELNNNQTYSNIPFFYIKITGNIVELIWDNKEERRI